MAQKSWTSGRGILGPLKPLIGDWVSEPAGPGKASIVRCRRRFTLFGKSWLALEAEWVLGPRGAYVERAFFGAVEEGTLGFRSFTNDGKTSFGLRAPGSDVHPAALAFEARMPAGLARMIYWPAEGGFHFAVESRTKRGWNRFLLHRYRPAD